MVQNHAKQDITVNVGDRFPLTIRRLGVNGHGIGYFKHKVCFVPGALPGEVVVAEVTKVMPRFLEAKIHRLRRTSKHRVTPRDSYADVAGGFELENLAYPDQLKFKRQVVLDSLSSSSLMVTVTTTSGQPSPHQRNTATGTRPSSKFG